MVDRITPVTTDEDRVEIGGFGIEDQWPVVCEPFTQWELEDSFNGPTAARGRRGAGRLRRRALRADEASVAERQPRARLLRSSVRLHYVHEAAQDPLFRSFLRGYMDEEATRRSTPSGRDLAAYKEELIERFSTPRSATRSLGSARRARPDPEWLMPVVRFQLSRRW